MYVFINTHVHVYNFCIWDIMASAESAGACFGDCLPAMFNLT